MVAKVPRKKALHRVRGEHPHTVNKVGSANRTWVKIAELPSLRELASAAKSACSRKLCEN
jgi:hypothetical protein